MQRHLTAVLCQVESTWHAGHQIQDMMTVGQSNQLSCYHKKTVFWNDKSAVFLLKIQISPVFLLKNAHISPVFLQNWARMKQPLHSNEF